MQACGGRGMPGFCRMRNAALRAQHGNAEKAASEALEEEPVQQRESEKM